MDSEWVTDIRDQCASAGVAFFFKQWGGKHKKTAGRILDGRTYDEMPIAAASTHSASLTPARVLPVVA
jgi:protein gp37